MNDDAILAGALGREVASFGLLRPPHVRSLIERSDSSSYHFGIVEESYSSGRIMQLVGGLVFAAGYVLVDANDDDTSAWIALGLGVTGAGLGIIGSRRVSRSRDAMSASIWWYNSSLPR
jgi:hypothetical protein